jgi:hypothetical protein
MVCLAMLSSALNAMRFSRGGVEGLTGDAMLVKVSDAGGRMNVRILRRERISLFLNPITSLHKRDGYEELQIVRRMRTRLRNAGQCNVHNGTARKSLYTFLLEARSTPRPYLITSGFELATFRLVA